MPSKPKPRTGGQILIDQLALLGLAGLVDRDFRIAFHRLLVALVCHGLLPPGGGLAGGGRGSSLGWVNVERATITSERAVSMPSADAAENAQGPGVVVVGSYTTDNQAVP